MLAQMIKRIIMFAVFLAGVSVSPAVAQTPSIPDITGWKQLALIPINFSSENGKIIYLGYEAEYQNPANLNEFIWIAARFNSIVLTPVKLSSDTPYAEIANNYLDQEIKQQLNSLIKNSDIFLYIRWKTKVDSQTGEMITDGSIESWLLDPNKIDDGNDTWFYGIINSIFVDDISEPNKHDNRRYLTIGRRYRLNGVQHILRTDQDYIIKSKEK